MTDKNPAATLPKIDWGRTDHLIELALAEDLDLTGDVTTLAVVPEAAECSAVLRCKEPGMVVAGLPVAVNVSCHATRRASAEL